MHYGVGTGINFPVRKFIEVTPSDTVDLPAGCTGLFVSELSALALMDVDGNVTTFPDVLGFAPLGPKRVMATGTNLGAGTLIALYPDR